MEYPKRKQVRLQEYDYSTPGAYFVTICTHEKRCILSKITTVGALHVAPLQGKRALLSKAVGYLKMNCSKRFHALCPERTLWQRSFYEHVIRNDRDFEEIWDYIETNPLRWTEDVYHA